MKNPVFPRILFLLVIALCATAGSAATPNKSPKTVDTPVAAGAPAAAKQPEVIPNIIPVSEIKPGMRGVAYPVFEGVKPEPMEVEVLGVLKNNFNGPKSDVILVRLHGEKVEFTGVVAGMSGSPVYFNGRLAGALAFRIGEFSKEPIAGVTPISEMLEISAIDSTPTSVPVQVRSGPSFAAKTSGPGLPSGTTQNFANYLKPIET